MKYLLLILALATSSLALAQNLQPPVPVQDGVDVAALITSTYGSGVIEYYLDNYDRIQSCGQNGAPDGSQCFYFWLKSTDGDKDENVDRARIEVRFSRAGAGPALLGETINYRWYFYVQPDIIITKKFCHIHQVKSHPATDAAQQPIITYLLESSKLLVQHVDSEGNASILKQIPASQIIGKWVYADEILKAGSDGWYQTTIYDAATQTPILTVPKTSLDMWRDGTQVQPKFGLYRYHGDWNTTYIAFSEWEITKLSA